MSTEIETGSDTMRFALIFAISIVLLVLPTSAVAEWSHDPLVNNLVCGEAGTQRYPQMVEDGVGGIFVCWRDETADNHKLYAQRIDADGNRLWAATGVEVCTYPSNQTGQSIVTDGAGGVIIVWTDSTESTDINIYAQRLGPDGTRLWASTGQRVVSASGYQMQHESVADDQGGVFVCWTDLRSGSDIYLQHLDSLGDESWTVQGLAICANPENQDQPVLARDGDEGVIVAWRDHRDASRTDIYAQRISIDGVVRWDVDGVAAEDCYERVADPSIAADQSGGVFITFTHDYGAGSENIFATRLDDSGNLSWGSGSMICNHDADTGSSKVVGDGGHGAYVVWRDTRGSGPQVFAQHVDHSGFVTWAGNGIPVTPTITGDISQWNFNVALDAQGGLLVALGDGRLDNINMDSIYAQRIAPNGAHLWTDEGVQVRTLAENVPSPVLIPSDDGGAMIVFHARNGPGNIDIFGQLVDAQGGLGVNAPVITSVADHPNDQGGQVDVSWTAAYLDRWPERRVVEYSVWAGTPDPNRSRPSTGTAPGEAPGRLATFVEEGWSFVQVVPALQFEDYACLAWTFGDSTGAGIVASAYLVIAHTEDPLVHWSSNVVSGYSVDNLAPPAPVDLAAAVTPPDQAELSWNAGGDDDDFSHYAVYRGDASGFPADPGHRIGTSTTPEYLDDIDGAPRWYRVTAVDVHGNESDTSNEVQCDPATSVADIPGVVALHRAVPNPFNPSTSLHFDLPRAASIRLEVFDAAGRRIAVLADGGWPAGRHEVAWNGRDSQGREMPSGVYLSRFEANGQVAHGRMTLVR